MKNIKKYSLLSLAGLLLVGCGNTSANEDSQSSQASSSSQDPQTVQIAHTQAYVPYNYIDDQGNSTGLEVEIMKAIDEKLDDYVFEFVPTSDDDLLIGVQSGKYAAGTKGIWKTAEREEDYIFPQEAIAASHIGLVYRTAEEDQYSTLESFAQSNGKLVPIAPQNAQYSVIDEFNQSNPDNQITLQPSEQFTVADAYAWVVEERYDGYVAIDVSFEHGVENEDAPYHEYADLLSFEGFAYIPTYVLVNEDHQDLADQYDQAYQELIEEGVVQQISEDFLGVNILDALNDASEE